MTLPEEAASAVVVAAPAWAPGSADHRPGCHRRGRTQLGQLGAQHVIHPELEGGLEIVRHTLLQLGFPLREVSLLRRCRAS